jgi:transposase-like protein
MKTMTINQLLERFPDNDACKRYLVERRWPEGIIACPKCGNVKVWHVTHRPFHWICKACNKNGYRFSVISGTIFENTKYPLRDWFKVIFLMAQSKKGMSALQIHRILGTGSYETAWYMCHRIRAAMQNETWNKLMGEVEVDETYVGGKPGNWHVSKRRRMREGHSKKGTLPGQPKVGVIGAISRKGNVVCKVMERTGEEPLSRFVRETVSDKVDLVATDDFAPYRGLVEYPHETVQHTKGEYVRGLVHTQNIDSFWSLLKRGIMGSYHQVNRKYLPLYLNEFTFRHNHRKDPNIFDSIVAGC